MCYVSQIFVYQVQCTDKYQVIVTPLMDRFKLSHS